MENEGFATPSEILDSREQLEERIANETAAQASPDLLPILGGNLRRLRVKRGLSLERLAKLSGVSRAMLSQIELGYSAPSINVTWKIARALGVTFGALLAVDDVPSTRVLRSAQAKLLTSHDGAFTSRALFPFDQPRHTEFYELRIKGHGVERADAHAPGTTENLIVTAGRAIIRVAGETIRLETSDAVLFNADAPHEYENPDPQPAILYLVMTYTEAVNG